MSGCPICGGGELIEANGRPAAQCKFCGAYERTRLMWLVLDQLLSERKSWRALHFAPERGLARKLKSVIGSGYRALDLNPSGFRIPGVEVEKFNLCSDVQGLADGGADLIVHSHVLEHVPCQVEQVVRGLNRALSPGGYHVFCVPIIGSMFEEDLNPALTGIERRTRFGQEDHVRRFGRLDTRSRFADMFGQEVHFSRLVGIDVEQLRGAGVPETVATEVNSHSVFVWRKPLN